MDEPDSHRGWTSPLPRPGNALIEATRVRRVPRADGAELLRSAARTAASRPELPAKELWDLTRVHQDVSTTVARMETADVQSAARTMPKPPELARLAVDSIRQFVATRDREQAEREAIRDREHAARYRDALRMIESMNEALQLSSAREERADKRADLAEKRQRWALAIAATSLVVTVVSFLSLIA